MPPTESPPVNAVSAPPHWSPPPIGDGPQKEPASAFSANRDRPALVLLAGMLGDASVWDELSRRINDLVKPWPIRIDLDDSVAELAAAVLAQAPQRFWLAGHSLGGIVALEVQRQAPERVAGLILVNASARGPSPTQLTAWSELERRIEGGAFDQVADELAAATLPDGVDPAVRAANRRMAELVGPDGLLRQLRAQRSRPDSRLRLGDLTLPVLVFGGELDSTCPLELQRELVAGCGQAELVEVRNAGHMLPLEAPVELAEWLRSWLQ